MACLSKRSFDRRRRIFAGPLVGTTSSTLSLRTMSSGSVSSTQFSSRSSSLPWWPWSSCDRYIETLPVTTRQTL